MTQTKITLNKGRLTSLIQRLKESNLDLLQELKHRLVAAQQFHFAAHLRYLEKEMIATNTQCASPPKTEGDRE
jgi:uncharacterized coiled-coil protein SlyX